MMSTVEWNEAKTERKRKHGVLREAQTVFLDENALRSLIRSLVDEDRF